jgi:hypothetical protein
MALARALEVWKIRDAAKTADACRALAESYSIDRNVQATLETLKELSPNEEKRIS